MTYAGVLTDFTLCIDWHFLVFKL